jgi:hypothetical protein
MTEASDAQADALLRALGRQARAESGMADPGTSASSEASWSELERWTRSELRPTRVAELEREGNGDPELAAALEAYRPLSEGVRAKLVARLSAETPAPQRSAPVLRPSFGRRVAVWAAPAVAAAAAVAALWLQGPAPAPLDGYVVEVQGAASVVRGAPSEAAAPLRVQAGSDLAVLVRPPAPDAAPATAHAFLQAGVSPGSAEKRPWAPLGGELSRANSGALRIGLKIPDFEEPAVLAIIVARSGVDVERAVRAPASTGPGWQRFSYNLERIAVP